MKGTLSVYDSLSFQQNIELKVLENDSVSLGEELGKGGEGVIYKCQVHGRVAAAKFLQDNAPENIDIMITEIEMMW